MHITIPPKYKEILKPIENIDYYFIGGFVRDIIMKRKPKDIDIIVFDCIDKLEHQFGQQAFIVNERFNTARFMIKGFIVDVNRAESLLNDIQRRDFTINALCADKNGKVIDNSSGLKDIEKGVLRPVTQKSFALDPIRILRAYRFRQDLNFRFSRGVKSMIKEAADDMLSAAPERILQEMLLLLSSPNSSLLLYDLYMDGVLTSIFPELHAVEHYYHRKCKTRKLIYHLLRTAQSIDVILEKKELSALRPYCSEHMFDLYMAALFHDIEKPSMERRVKKGLSFAGHDINSAKTASGLLKERLRLPKENIIRISRLIKMHMRPHLLVESEKVTRRGFFRLMRDADDDLPGLFALAIADKLASDCIFDMRYLDLYSNVLNIRKAIENKSINIINGRDIMNAFGLKPSPLIGKLIEAGNEYAVQEHIDDKSRIIDFLKKQFNLSV